MTVAGQMNGAPAQPAHALPYAGVSLRIVAFILDTLVLFSVFSLFVVAAGLHLLLRSDWGNDSTIPDKVYWTSTLIILIFLAVPPWYFLAMWWSRGQSLGMMAVRIAVTNRDGHHLTFGQAFVRTLVWPLGFLPLGIGMLPIVFDRESRALHDMLAGTVVVELP
jgi:uncharacterized RDD family membrane protein YckC